MERSNPYADFGGTVTGTRFVGRESELRAIASRIFGARGFGSIAVVGLPRIGKTSLVFEAIRLAEESSSVWRRTVVVRSNVGTATSVDSLFRFLIDDLADSVRERGLGEGLVDKRIAEAIAAPVVGFGMVRAVFRALRRADIRPVWVLDEFDAGRRVFEDSPQCFHWLRELCSNPEFKSAVVLVAKRRLQDVARLAGHESNYWANVLMTLPLKPLPDGDVQKFLLCLEEEGVALNHLERTQVLALCGGHPYLLDAFAYHAWNLVDGGRRISVEWIEATFGRLLHDYFEQVSTVLDDGPMLSKAVQVFVGPQWDVTSADTDALCELGIALRDEEGVLRSFSSTFEEYLRVVERGIDIWPLWRETERVVREVLEQHLERAFGPDWPDALCKAKPKRKGLIESCREKRAKEQGRFGARAEASLLAYTYPKELYDLMVTDWTTLGAPLFGSDKQRWALKFDVLSKVRTPLAHNREETVSDGERDQAKGICHWTTLGAPLFGSDKQRWALKFDVLSKVRTPLAHNREETVSDGERDQAKGICQEILDLYRKFSG